MSTVVLAIDALKPEPERIARAAEVLRRGGLVAFPTETVYGLGANALDAGAVARIFIAKGRPAANPVIVHVPSVEDARACTAAWPEAAERLARRFWPGPLSLVLPRHPRIPEIVTAGGPTVAVRMPAHPVALALVLAAGVPVAAPSANRSNCLSPTRAAHVLAGLEGRMDLLLDAGPCPGGLESTVLDLTTEPPRLLRPGLITPGQIEEVIGPISRQSADSQNSPLRSPGLMARHYAPRAVLEIGEQDAGERAAQLTTQGLRVGRITFVGEPTHKDVHTLELPRDPAGYAAELYAALHTLDAAGVERIIVDAPPRTEGWLAIHDRLRRASAR